MAPVEESREEVLNEVLAKTNKPRFCYMGYAPPLCIGDDFDKPTRNASLSKASKPGVAVPFPKKGKGPDALFSSSTPLCIGDTFPGSGIHKKSSNENTKVAFKPTGRAPAHLLGKLEYISVAESIQPLPVKKREVNEKKAFVPPAAKAGGLFQPVFEFIPAPTEISKTVPKLSNEKLPFRVPTGSSPIPPLARSEESTPEPHLPESNPVHKGPLENDKAAFRPGGGHVAHPHVEYMSPVLKEIPKKAISIEKTSWKPRSANLVTSPHPSIVFMNLRL